MSYELPDRWQTLYDLKDVYFIINEDIVGEFKEFNVDIFRTSTPWLRSTRGL